MMGKRADGRVPLARTAVLRVVAACILATVSAAAVAADRHAGYYYPIPATSETAQGLLMW